MKNRNYNYLIIRLLHNLYYIYYLLISKEILLSINNFIYVIFNE